MESSSSVSAPHHMICPSCESAELQFGSQYSARCAGCGYVPSLAVLGTLRQIVTLPDALGAHACEGGYPEMRRLPNGVFHCPACGSEVLPLKACSVLSKKDRSEAHRCDRSDRGITEEQRVLHPARDCRIRRSGAR